MVCIFCRKEYGYPSEWTYIFCNTCLFGIVDNMIDSDLKSRITVVPVSVDFTMLGEKIKRLLRYKTDKDEKEHVDKFKGFYCGNDTWIIPDWYLDQSEHKQMFDVLIGRIVEYYNDHTWEYPCDMGLNSKLCKYVDEFVNFLESVGVHLYDDVQIKKPAKSARSII